MILSANTLQIGGSWSLQAGSVQGPFAVFVFGDTTFDPGIPLDALGAPGCSGYTNASLGAFPNVFTSGVSTFSVSVPPASNLLGYTLTVQASASSTATPAGFVTSNGATAVLGI